MTTPPIQRILVTGGCGFIGTNFIQMLAAHRPAWHIVNLDALTYAGTRTNLASLESSGRYTFHHGDIRDRDAVLRAMRGADAVVHFAAESHVDRSINDSGPFLSTNAIGTQVLLDACRDLASERPIAKFVQIGTDEVYGSLPIDRPDLRFTENSPLAPNSPYSASKAAADLLALSYHHTFGLPTVVTRCSNNYGPFQFPEKVIPLFITHLMEGRKVPLYGDGLNVRDWIHVADHCEAVLSVLERGRPGEVYNFGGDNELSNIDLTRAILAMLDKDDDAIEWVRDRPGHDRRYAIDATKAKRELGWTPIHGAWPKALAETVEWYKANHAWWRPLKARAFNATMLSTPSSRK